VIRLIVRTAVSVGAAAVGLIVAAAILERMAIDAVSFVAVVVIFAVVGGLLGPFVMKTAMRNAPAVMGGIGLVTTFVALLITDLISDGLTIRGLTTWILATLIVWLATMLASILLPVILVTPAWTHCATTIAVSRATPAPRHRERALQRRVGVGSAVRGGVLLRGWSS